MTDIDFKKLFTMLGHEMIRATGLRLIKVNDKEFCMALHEDDKDEDHMYTVYIDDMYLVISKSHTTMSQYGSSVEDKINISIALSDPLFDQKWKTHLQIIRKDLKTTLPYKLQGLQSSKKSIVKKIDHIKGMLKRIK